MCRKPFGRGRKRDEDDEDEEEEKELWDRLNTPIPHEINAMDRVRDKVLVRALAAAINASLQTYRDGLRYI